MERDFLKQLGIEEDNVNKIMTQYGKDAQELREKLNKGKSTIEGLTEQLSKRDDQIKDLGKQVSDNKDLQDIIDKYKEEIDK